MHDRFEIVLDDRYDTLPECADLGSSMSIATTCAPMYARQAAVVSPT
jgi:hypothetical protein